MDFHLKQPMEKQQHQKVESEEEQQQPSPAKFPRLHLQLESHHHQHQQDLSSPSPSNLFSLSPCPADSKPPLPATSRFPCRVGGYFSTDQWQELEVQALIFRHMVAGAAVPFELLQLVKKSILNSSSLNLSNNTFSYYQPALFQAGGSWSKGAVDPEPGRCRRTDGKKWRCSRDVVANHKYCERHVHRGRNRSRKPVESAVPTANTAATCGTTLGRGVVSGSDLLGVGTHNHKSSAFAPPSQQYAAGLVGGGDGDRVRFSLSSPTSSLDIFQLNQGASQPSPDGKFLYKSQNDAFGDSESKLRHFFDDWPKPDHTSIGGASPVDSSTCLSISTPGVDPSVDFLKLSTGNGGDSLSRKVDGEWSGGNEVGAAGGPLAEAFRPSIGASTTGVLHQLPQSASGTSCVAA